jgi:hypothetical protein
MNSVWQGSCNISWHTWLDSAQNIWPARCQSLWSEQSAKQCPRHLTRQPRVIVLFSGTSHTHWFCIVHKYSRGRERCLQHRPQVTAPRRIVRRVAPFSCSSGGCRRARGCKGDQHSGGGEALTQQRHFDEQLCHAALNFVAPSLHRMFTESTLTVLLHELWATHFPVAAIGCMESSPRTQSSRVDGRRLLADGRRLK